MTVVIRPRCLIFLFILISRFLSRCAEARLLSRAWLLVVVLLNKYLTGGAVLIVAFKPAGDETGAVGWAV